MGGHGCDLPESIFIGMPQWHVGDLHMQAQTPLLDQIWHGIAEEVRPFAQKTLADLVQRDKAALASAFYAYMLDDSNAAGFLSIGTVESRLKPGLERWLDRLFCYESDEELQAVLALQRHVGEVHARSEISVYLVARGMRLLKREIAQRVLQTDLSPEILIASLLRSDRLIDIAFEHMSSAFVQSNESRVRVDESYRMYAAGQNLSLEREKQLGALLEWENRLFRALATENSFDDLQPLSKSSIGLWLHHKASLIFDETLELPAIDESMRRVDESLYPQLAISHRHKLTAEEFRALVKSTTLELEQIKYLMGAMFDRMTDLEVGRDVLTQLFNRRFLQTILKREIELSRRKGQKFCVLMLDIDRFKLVNDQYGHDVGDRVLQTIAGVLMGHVRASDFVFRYGGEEFLIVLAESDTEQAMQVAEKIRQRIGQTSIPLPDERSLAVTASIGLAGFDGHPDFQNLFNRADKAMYEAKNGGRNRCFVASA
jgi:diguanylate cyclase